MVVECTSIQDLNVVLHEGIKNRHQGSEILKKNLRFSEFFKKMKAKFFKKTEAKFFKK